MKGLNGGFKHWRVSGLAISSVAACFGSPNVYSVDFALFQPLRNQHSPSRLVLRLYSCPTTILHYNLCLHFIPHHSPNVNIPDTSLHFQQAKFSILFSRNFCGQQLVPGRLSNTVKWSTFCVSFIHVLTILGLL